MVMLPDRVARHKYKQSLHATGGNPPYKWALAIGSVALPPGLKLSGAGVVSGKPTSGSWTFQVSVTDKKSKSKPHTQNTATHA